jgi:hypothetical protein
MPEIEFDLNKILKGDINNCGNASSISDRQKKIAEIKEDLRLTLDIVREMTKEYKTLEPITWPATLMLLFNEIRQTRKEYVWPQIGGTVGQEIGEDPSP